MAKDGTLRGGARPGSGSKKKPLAEKIVEGKATKNDMALPEMVDLKAEEVPDCKEYMIRKQKDGSTLCAGEVYKDTMLWLKSYHCEKMVNRQLVEQYAMSVARWIACQDAISDYGYLAKHPTTQAPSTSPFVTMAQNFCKESTQLWCQIYSIVKENSSISYGASGVADPMEALLNKRGM